jgi:nucleotide-binding universal stress UspA family protein
VTTLKTMPHPVQSRTRLTYLQGLATRLNQQGVNAYAEIQHGNVVDSIVGMAHDGFDVLVMATHGRKGLERVVFGSVAEAVLRRAPCPVLLLPTWLES